MESNLGRLQVELYKEIKRNGAARSLRAALSRFAQMAHLIRSAKCRPYIVNLLPCLQRIAHRTEESVQETLGILGVLDHQRTFVPLSLSITVEFSLNGLGQRRWDVS